MLRFYFIFLFQGGVVAEIERKTIVDLFIIILFLIRVYTHLRLEKKSQHTR